MYWGKERDDSLPLAAIHDEDIAEVNDKVKDELEGIQERLGRVLLGVSEWVAGVVGCMWELCGYKLGNRYVIRRICFFLRMKGSEEHQCSRVFFESRQNKGWACEVDQLMQDKLRYEECCCLHWWKKICCWNSKQRSKYKRLGSWQGSGQMWTLALYAGV